LRKKRERRGWQRQKLSCSKNKAALKSPKLTGKSLLPFVTSHTHSWAEKTEKTEKTKKTMGEVAMTAARAYAAHAHAKKAKKS
jgi:hypothetical protein